MASQTGLPTAASEDPAEKKAGEEQLREDRIERFMSLTYKPKGRENVEGQMRVAAFTRKEAEVLADVKVVDEVTVREQPKRYESPLHQSKVQKMLDQGCSPTMVMRILGD